MGLAGRVQPVFKRMVLGMGCRKRPTCQHGAPSTPSFYPSIAAGGFRPRNSSWKVAPKTAILMTAKNCDPNVLLMWHAQNV